VENVAVPEQNCMDQPEDGENAELIEEQVLPERVMRPDANRIVSKGERIMLTTAEARWLLEALADLVPLMEADDAETQRKIDARRTSAKGE
jgi:hypothetical protein